MPAPGRAPTTAQAVAAYVAGLLLSRLIGAAGDATVGPFVADPSFVATGLLLLAAGRSAREPSPAHSAEWELGLLTACAVVLDRQLHLILRNGPAGPEAATLFAPVSWAGSAILGAMLLAVWAAGGRGDRGDGAGRHELHGFLRRLGRPTLQAILVIGSVILFRAVQGVLAAQGFPNEQRSTFIWGYEVHHFAYGAVMLCLGLAWAAPSTAAGSFPSLLIGLGAGFVADELLYYYLIEVSDAAYFGGISWAGAVLGVALAVGPALPLRASAGRGS